MAKYKVVLSGYLLPRTNTKPTAFEYYLPNCFDDGQILHSASVMIKHNSAVAGILPKTKKTDFLQHFQGFYHNCELSVCWHVRCDRHSQPSCGGAVSCSEAVP